MTDSRVCGWWLCLVGLVAAGCSHVGVVNNPPPMPASAAAPVAPGDPDEHSYAQPAKVRVVDMALDLRVDFAERTLSGSATHRLTWTDPAATELILDTRDLQIHRVEGAQSGGRWEPLEFGLAPADATLGAALRIQTPRRPARVRIHYTTSPGASGLQWLEPVMTAGKRTPFMFSQSQQIHARSWVPLQDTPQVRFTYSARIRTPRSALALMSADNDPKAARDGDYAFRMPQPIPSYLLAIAAGDLVFAPVSERCGVWAEPSMVQSAAAEFADTEKMMQAAERLYGPYRWGRYDMLVLPPSFPYGGMENPRLTFLTPTAIVGDRSLVSLVAHELAHSWSGNQVTFSTPRDAWLNEGFTSYVEMRLVEVLFGQERAEMELELKIDALRKEFDDTNRERQRLAVRPGSLPDPDDHLTGTIYTKGAWFLLFLEQRFGREDFDRFLRGYFDHFAFQSISSVQFAEYARANLLGRHAGRVTQAEFEDWLYEPGVPMVAPKVHSGKLAAVNQARAEWQQSGQLPAPGVTQAWSTHEWVRFIEGMPTSLPVESLAGLDAAYRFTGTPNGEIAQRWYPLAVRSGYAAANTAIAEFLQRVGRRKLIMPTYKELVKTPEGLGFAATVFAAARPGYHPITTGSVEAVIAGAKRR